MMAWWRSDGLVAVAMALPLRAKMRILDPTIVTSIYFFLPLTK